MVLLDAVDLKGRRGASLKVVIIVVFRAGLTIKVVLLEGIEAEYVHDRYHRGYHVLCHIMLISPPAERPAPIFPALPIMPGIAMVGLLFALSCNSGLHGGECCLWYLSPFKFLYRFWQTSHLYGFSFSMPMVPG